MRPDQAKGPTVEKILTIPPSTVTGAANVGAGTGDSYKNEIAGILNFRTLLAGTGISIATGTDEVTISSSLYTDQWWLAPIIAFFDNSHGIAFPVNIGDRYVAMSTAYGWTMDHVYTWDGAVWQDYTPVQGVTLVNTYDGSLAVYNGLMWTSTDYQGPVSAIYDNTVSLPPTPSVGDRYIAQVTANGWTANNVYTWAGPSGWHEYAPARGVILADTGLNVVYEYDGAQWSTLSLHWLKPVKDIFDNTAGLPTFPAFGERHLAKVTAHGWTIDHVYEYTPLGWTDTMPIAGPRTGMTTYLFAGPSGHYTYGGSGWTPVMNLPWDPWFSPIISIYDNTASLPPSPATASWYIAEVTANGWTANYLYYWNTSLAVPAWEEHSPNTGTTLYNTDTGTIIFYNGSAWITASDDHLVLATSGDTTPGYLIDKIFSDSDSSIVVGGTEGPGSITIGIVLDNVSVEEWVNILRVTNLPVISIFDNTSGLPPTPTTGDRYIALVTAHGWTANVIYESYAASWVARVPTTGLTLYNKDISALLMYNGAEWVLPLGDSIPVYAAAPSPVAGRIMLYGKTGETKIYCKFPTGLECIVYEYTP